MLRFLTDEDFHGPIVRGLRARNPALELVRAQAVGLMGLSDADVLAWAAANQRVILSHDRNTMTAAAYARMKAGEPMAGLIVVDDRMTIGRAIDEILIADGCSEMDEWADRVEFIS
jgi:predicted nuclease of predicted toxin-antitoxin system